MWKCEVLRKGVPILLVLMFGMSVYAQQQLTSNVQVFSYGSAGYCDLNIQSLNKMTKNLGLEAFSTKPFTFELGSQLFVEHLVLESGIGGIVFESRSSRNQKGTLLGGYGQLGIGMNVMEEGSSWKLYPFFSAGAQVYRFSYHAETMRFNSLPASTDAQVYWMPNFYTSYGCAIFKTFNLEKSGSLVTLGIKGGIYVDPTIQSTWYRDGIRYESGPSPQFSGPFFQIIIGSGSFITG